MSETLNKLGRLMQHGAQVMIPGPGRDDWIRGTVRGWRIQLSARGQMSFLIVVELSEPYPFKGLPPIQRVECEIAAVYGVDEWQAAQSAGEPPVLGDPAGAPDVAGSIEPKPLQSAESEVAQAEPDPPAAT